MNNQLITLVVEHSKIYSFTRNVFDGFNKGVKFHTNSSGTISDSIFMNMIQDIKENTIYQSNVVSDGSAIGEFLYK